MREVALDGFVAVWSILGGIGIGKARPVGVLYGFDGDEPGGLDRKSGGGVEVADKGADAGEVVGVEGGCDSRVSDKDVWWTSVGIIFRAEREVPYFGASGVLPAFEENALLVFVKDGAGFLVKEDLAAAVAELSDAKKVVLEGGHDLAVAGGKGGSPTWDVGACGLM